LSDSQLIVGIPLDPNAKSAPAPSSGLRHALKQRHMTMIALGGVIGAGLFVGSGVVIKAAGPAAVVSFVITGLLVVLVMRMLGEMAVALPAAVHVVVEGRSSATCCPSNLANRKICSSLLGPPHWPLSVPAQPFSSVDWLARTGCIFDICLCVVGSA